MLRRMTALAGSALLSGCSLFGIRSGYEQPAYAVEERLSGRVEIRRYGARLAAETIVESTDERDGQNAAFRILAGYIFGANRAREEVAMTAPVEVAARSEAVAMTAPVETRSDPGSVSMRFFLPSRYTRDSAPVPEDARVRIIEVPGETIAVLRFSGLGRRRTVAARQEELLREVSASGWRAEGAPFALFYDPPWTLPFLRRNEAAVRVVR